MKYNIETRTGLTAWSEFTNADIVVMPVPQQRTHVGNKAPAFVNGGDRLRNVPQGVGSLVAGFFEDRGSSGSEDWRNEALCAQTDPEMFYPEKGEREKIKAAKQICARCAVIKTCLDYALKHDERFGVWGGMTPGERRRLKRGGKQD